MNSIATPPRSVIANVIYTLLNPIPFGMFVAALIFDIVYAQTAIVLWGKAAAWLIFMGLVFAIIPRVLNLIQVWGTLRRTLPFADKLDFWLNLLAIIAAIFNALVHTRDAYAVIPAGVWLSAITVILLCIGRLVVAFDRSAYGSISHE